MSFVCPLAHYDASVIFTQSSVFYQSYLDALLSFASKSLVLAILQSHTHLTTSPFIIFQFIYFLGVHSNFLMKSVLYFSRIMIFISSALATWFNSLFFQFQRFYLKWFSLLCQASNSKIKTAFCIGLFQLIMYWFDAKALPYPVPSTKTVEVYS